MPDAVALARLETDMMGKVMALASDLGDALARPRAGVHGTRLVSFPGVHEMRRNLPQTQNT